MNIRGIGFGIALGCMLAANGAFAAPEGLFIGAGAGQSTMKAKSENNIGPRAEIDQSDTAYDGYAGYNFAKWFGVEGGYVELGSADKTRNILAIPGNPDQVKGEISANGWYGFGVLYLPLGDNFDLFGKVGGIAGNIDLKTRVHISGDGFQHNDSSEGNGMMAYGAGAALNFGHWSIRGEYTAYDVSKLDDLYLIEGRLQYTFFHEKEKPAPVASTPPPPPPKPMAAAAPAKCPDSDRDGVCDAVDQCPNTPAGARVGPGGCDCDYTLNIDFPFDSAELHADDKAKIDAIIPVLKNPKLSFIAGEVDGYTDNTGEAAYKVGLSQRLAQAVADYVKSQGVVLGDRFKVNGYGEEYPVASNDTKEGRAQNRRVVLRRTDCGAAH